MRATLTEAEIKAWKPYARIDDGHSALARARARMQGAQQWADWQMIGRRMTVGCVALEITQRCNLDCSYCYLSESSEALKDIPIEEVFRRIDLIFEFYGANTDVQVTGGDPTLRKRDELVAIVRYIKQKGLRASLFTNGIKATRDLLEELCAAGLEDVAFHVDMTQGRAGFASEQDLNALRLEYMQRARGLPLAVIFNTTAFPGNFHEIPALARFFADHAALVRFASFQVGADTGRGITRARVTVNPSTVMDAIRAGVGANLNFNAASAGHAECNGYAYGLIVNGRVHDFFNDPTFVHEVLELSARVSVDRADKRALIKAIATFFARNPLVFLGVVQRLATFAWQNLGDLVAARGRVRKISFFVHNFMDAKTLDKERCDACAFMVMTPEGPMSMCVHNAKRDDYLLVPAAVKRESKMHYFNPITGQMNETMPTNIAVALSRKNARGRAKESLQAAE